jgi:LysM repeat protein
MPINRRSFLEKTALLVLGMAGASRLDAAAALSGGGATYRVKRGDTLSGIAAQRGTTVAQLKAANGLTSDRILVGQVLVIPGARPAALAPVIASMRDLRIPRDRWQMIVGHHSAIRYGNAKTYDRNHKERGMANGLAYHFVIGNGVDSGDGEIEVGGRWTGQIDGGHVRDSHVNHVGIGICCVGNFESAVPTQKQVASFEALVRFLRDEVMGGRASLAVHREIDGAQTLCPGKNFPINAIRRRLA